TILLRAFVIIEFLIALALYLPDSTSSCDNDCTANIPATRYSAAKDRNISTSGLMYREYSSTIKKCGTRVSSVPGLLNVAFCKCIMSGKNLMPYFITKAGLSELPTEPYIHFSMYMALHSSLVSTLLNTFMKFRMTTLA